MELIDRAAGFGERIAVADRSGTFSYAQLLTGSARAAARLLAGGVDLEGERIAFMVEPSFDYVRIQWGIWRAGGVAVPLCLTHPAPELEYVLDTVRPVGLFGVFTIMTPGARPCPRSSAAARSSCAPVST